MVKNHPVIFQLTGVLILLGLVTLICAFPKYYRENIKKTYFFCYINEKPTTPFMFHKGVLYHNNNEYYAELNENGSILSWNNKYRYNLSLSDGALSVSTLTEFKDIGFCQVYKPEN